MGWNEKVSKEHKKDAKAANKLTGRYGKDATVGSIKKDANKVAKNLKKNR